MSGPPGAAIPLNHADDFGHQGVLTFRGKQPPVGGAPKGQGQVVGAVLAVVNPQGCPRLAPLLLLVLEIQGNTGSI